MNPHHDAQGKFAAAQGASKHAEIVSKQANKSGSAELHQRAAAAHGRAADAHDKAGNKNEALTHRGLITRHERAAGGIATADKQLSRGDVGGGHASTKAEEAFANSSTSTAHAISPQFGHHYDAAKAATAHADKTGSKADHVAAAVAHEAAMNAAQKAGRPDIANKHRAVSMDHANKASGRGVLGGKLPPGHTQEDERKMIDLQNRKGPTSKAGEVLSNKAWETSRMAKTPAGFKKAIKEHTVARDAMVKEGKHGYATGHQQYIERMRSHFKLKAPK